MRGHIVAEERFLRQGVDHHLFVTGIENFEHEYRFEVRRIPPGSDHPETIFEKTFDFSGQPKSSIDELIKAKLQAIQKEVTEEETIHAHDP